MLALLIIVLSVLTGNSHATDSDCADVQKKVGSMLYISVDGYGAPDGKSIHPEYLKLIKEMDPAGILNHSNPLDLEKIREGYKAAREASTSGLLIGVDYHSFKASDYTLNMHIIGLGHGGGLVSKRTDVSNDACFEQVAYLEAFLHKTLGINHALGPTIENNPRWGVLSKDAKSVKSMSDPVFKSFERFGIATTMKHFPYTPETFNLHTMSKDVKVKESDVDKMLEIFKLQGSQADFAMSTHIYNSEIDPDDMATFSKKWISKLRNECGYDGLLMTDALFMISRYDDTMKSMSKKWNKDEAGGIDDEQTIFAVRSILAGHDIVFLDGTSATHRKIWGNLKKIACMNTPLGMELKKRILESSSRVMKYKKEHTKELNEMPKSSYDLANRSGILRENIYKTGFSSCPLDEFKKIQTEIEALGIAKGPAPVFKDSAECVKKTELPVDPSKILPNFEVIVEPDPLHKYE